LGASCFNRLVPSCDAGLDGEKQSKCRGQAKHPHAGLHRRQPHYPTADTPVLDQELGGKALPENWSAVNAVADTARLRELRTLSAFFSDESVSLTKPRHVQNSLCRGFAGRPPAA